jgi:hypothetical protein
MVTLQSTATQRPPAHRFSLNYSLQRHREIKVPCAAGSVHAALAWKLYVVMDNSWSLNFALA